MPDLEAVTLDIKTQAQAGNIRVTQHAHQEMAEEDITLGQLLEAIAEGEILEYYEEHRRGACCLVNGTTTAGRPLHVLCTATRPVLIVITVYEPRPPKWETPTQRRRTS